MIALIITLIIVGLIAGALARLIVPGRQEMSVPATILLGIVGSFVGGFIGYLIHHSRGFSPAGLLGSIIGAIVVLLIWTRVGSRGRVVR